jgi:hypothetical protein
LSSSDRARLHQQLLKLKRCHGPESCESAEHISQFP